MNKKIDLAADQRSRIRALNDRLRSRGVGGRILVTRSVIAVGPDFMKAAVQHMRDFDRFDSGDDPYGEHDFGAFSVNGERLFFKIDYYDPSMTAGSEDPSDPAKCTRVLTLMLAADY
jgi:hypothetical protein